jgi:N-acetylmuramoyl-L-alanine amidase
MYIKTVLILLFIIPASIFGRNDNGKLSVLVIDAGHGGEDPGALGKTHIEKDITLGIALKVGKYISEKHNDVKIIYTRKTDVLPALHERAEIANRNNADLFISIHANANKNHSISGIETYFMGLHTDEKNMEVAKKENAVITYEKDYSSHYEGYDPNSSESFIIFSLMQNAYLAQSLEFAGDVQESSKKVINRYDRGVKQAGFLVLWKTTMPSVLIEVGFISNEKEEKYMSSEEGQQQIAKAIASAFSDYKSRIESKSVIIASDSNSIIEKEKKDQIPAIANEDTILYMVQIVSASNPVDKDAAIFNNCKKIKEKAEVVELFNNGMYKYFIGESGTYTEITEYAAEVKKYFPEAFVVATQNGKIIPLNEAIKR